MLLTPSAPLTTRAATYPPDGTRCFAAALLDLGAMPARICLPRRQNAVQSSNSILRPNIALIPLLITAVEMPQIWGPGTKTFGSLTQIPNSQRVARNEDRTDRHGMSWHLQAKMTRQATARRVCTREMYGTGVAADLQYRPGLGVVRQPRV